MEKRRVKDRKTSNWREENKGRGKEECNAPSILETQQQASEYAEEDRMFHKSLSFIHNILQISIQLFFYIDRVL